MRFRPSLVLVLLAAPVLAADKPFFFQKGDRVVFLGDSITEQYQYSTYVELYLTTRFPEWEMTFLNAGIGGDTANGGANRFQSHVLNEKPTAVTINFGMNDAGYGKFDSNRHKTYVEKTAAMLEMAKKAGVRVALMSPNAVDRRRSPGFSDFKVYLETQKEFYAPLQGLAEKHGATFVDQYAVTRAALEKMEADKATTVVPFGDGFHTSPPGGLLMAHTILTGLEAPGIVSDVVINGSKAEAKGCKVENLVVKEGELSFDRTDSATPFPIMNEWVTLLPYVNNLKDLNNYGLTVKGLAKGTYEIAIDGKAVMKATAEELDKGVNLGLATTGPVYDQGMKVLTAINDKNRIVHGRFRGVVMFQPPDWLADVAQERKAKELAKRMEQIDARQGEIYKMARPATRKVAVKPI
jgi:lysophospholipase L1-like esterase